MMSCHGWMAMMPLSDLIVFICWPSSTVSMTMRLLAQLYTKSLPRMGWQLPSAATTSKGAPPGPIQVSSRSSMHATTSS